MTGPGSTARRWTALAPAKVNLCLYLGPVRADGRHELVSVMQSLSLADELTLSVADGGAAADEVLCPGVAGPNLAADALAAYRAATGWCAPPVRVHITKRIPVAAGMAGGSADAGATLRLASAAAGWWADGAPGPAAGGEEELLLELAAGLGADVPAQVRPGRFLATGAGERLRRLSDPARFGVLVLACDAGLSTPAVFDQADRMSLPRSAGALAQARHQVEQALLRAPDALPAVLAVNELAPAARALEPGIDEALRDARRVGASVALVCGSGPTVVGLFAGPGGPARARGAAQRLAHRRPPALAAEPVGDGVGAPTIERVRHNPGSGSLS